MTSKFDAQYQNSKIDAKSKFDIQYQISISQIVLDFGSLQAGQTTSVYYRGLNVTWRKNVREKFASIFANYYALGLECYAVMQHCAMQ